MLATLLALIQAPAPDLRVNHPLIPCWEGERSWTPPGEKRSDMVVYRTQGDPKPLSMSHHRDHLIDGDELVQDYNFIDYEFGDPARPLRARHYLNEDSVFVDLPGERPATLALAQAAFPPDLLCYFQKRFPVIEVLVADGYKEIWSLSGQTSGKKRPARRRP